MKYLLAVPFRFAFLGTILLILAVLTAIGSIVLVLWHLDLRWVSKVKNYFWEDDYYFLTIKITEKTYCYKTFWDAVLNRPV